MNSKMTPWFIALALTILSTLIVVLPTPLPQVIAPPTAEDGSAELASIGEAEAAGSEQAEIGGEGREAGMVVHSTTSAAVIDESPLEATLEPPDGETVTVQGTDLALGKRFPVSQQAAPRVQSIDAPDADAKIAASRQVSVRTQVLSSGPRQQRFVIENMAPEDPSDASPTPAQPTLSEPLPLVLTLTAGRYQFAELGGWEVPIIVVARKRQEGSGELAGTRVPEAMSILVEAPGTEPRTVIIEANQAWSTEAVVVPLRRNHNLEVTATDLADDAEAGHLELSWRAHGPKSKELRVNASSTDGYATRLSPIRLDVQVAFDGQPLPTYGTLPVQTSTSKKVTVEPTDAVLNAKGEQVRLTVIGHGDGTETVKIQVPDLDLETEVTLHFRRPYLFLALAALFGVLGVMAARRSQLFKQSKGAIALELLASAIGGVLLYAAFLMQWLPTPGFLIGALPASAVGIMGGYAGKGVFDLLLKVLGLSK